MHEVKTRSQWVSERSPLDDIFGEEDTQQFADALYSIPDLLFVSDESVALARKLSKGEPDEVIAPKPLIQEVSKFIRIIHGPHGQDYVWHVEPASIRRPWRRDEHDILYLVAKTMHENLPEIEARLWLPEGNWELRTITFKAFGLLDHWGFDIDRVPSINIKLFEVLNTAV